jgi:uncharacterized peroxidase-related enzyme
MPIVPNFMTALGASAPALKFWTILTETMIETLTLPQAFQPIIFYAVAAHANCEYCSASNEVQCRMLGMDEDTLAAMAKDLPSVNPARLRVIVEFCIKVSQFPQQVDRADFNALRDQGVSDAEILELVTLTALAVASDIFADALKMPVDPMVLEALGR